jgi:NAD(P)H-hydrate epimerase
MISPLESKILDINSEACGVPLYMLMDNAGAALFDAVSKRSGGKRILIVCGKGNNGGDGFACAGLFGKEADVALLFPPEEIRTEEAAYFFNLLDSEPEMFSCADLKKYDVIVDCVLGTGVRSPLDDIHTDYVNRLKGFEGCIVSADVPTGFGTGCSFVPDVTVTFHDVKEGMTKENCGETVIADIGIPADASRLVGPGDMLRYPIPKRGSHKGQNGRLLIVGGGPYIGAPAMAGMAAFRVGVDLVHIATPKRSFIPIASMTPIFIMHQTSDDTLTENDVSNLLELSKNVDAVLIGPGLGTADGTMKAVRRFVDGCDRPIVVDADGITAISSMPVIPGNVIITPHRRELAAFSGDGDDVASVQRISAERNVTVLLKGEEDVIVHNDKIRYNETGTPAMTVGGTGDVLAGIVSGLLSKGMSTFDSACVGAYICGLAGEYAFSEYSYGLVATDVIDEIANVLIDHLDV